MLRRASDAERPTGRHRYDVGQGFRPERIELRGLTADEVMRGASDHMGRAILLVAVGGRVAVADDGPPACWVPWSGRLTAEARAWV